MVVGDHVNLAGCSWTVLGMDPDLVLRHVVPNRKKRERDGQAEALRQDIAFLTKKCKTDDSVTEGESQDEAELLRPEPPDEGDADEENEDKAEEAEEEEGGEGDDEEEEDEEDDSTDDHVYPELLASRRTALLDLEQRDLPVDSPATDSVLLVLPANTVVQVWQDLPSKPHRDRVRVCYHNPSHIAKVIPAQVDTRMIVPTGLEPFTLPTGWVATDLATDGEHLLVPNLASSEVAQFDLQGRLVAVVAVPAPLSHLIFHGSLAIGLQNSPPVLWYFTLGDHAHVAQWTELGPRTSKQHYDHIAVNSDGFVDIHMGVNPYEGDDEARCLTCQRYCYPTAMGEHACPALGDRDVAVVRGRVFLLLDMRIEEIRCETQFLSSALLGLVLGCLSLPEVAACSTVNKMFASCQVTARQVSWSCSASWLLKRVHLGALKSLHLTLTQDVDLPTMSNLVDLQVVGNSELRLSGEFPALASVRVEGPYVSSINVLTRLTHLTMTLLTWTRSMIFVRSCQLQSLGLLDDATVFEVADDFYDTLSSQTTLSDLSFPLVFMLSAWNGLDLRRLGRALPNLSRLCAVSNFFGWDSLYVDDLIRQQTAFAKLETLVLHNFRASPFKWSETLHSKSNVKIVQSQDPKK